MIYLACGQQKEEGRAGFPTRVNRGESRLLSRDLSMAQRVKSSIQLHHMCKFGGLVTMFCKQKQ